MNTYTAYFDAPRWVQVYQEIATLLGKTPREVFESCLDVFSLLQTVEAPAPGQAHGVFKAGITMDVFYDPATLTVSRVRTYHHGDLVEEWSGSMTVEKLLSGNWPCDVVYGTSGMDLLYVEGDEHLYAGAGNDILQLADNAVGHGGAGVDAFDLIVGHGSHVTIADYQPGEKILFPYNDWATLVNAFQGVSNVSAHGFTLNFGGPSSYQWSLTIEGAPLEQMRLEDLLVGQAGENQIYAPVLAAFGVV